MAYERLFVTGGAGFIGSAFVRHALAAAPDCQIVVFDLLTYAGHRENLAGLDATRVELVVGDVADPDAVDAALGAFQPEAVIHIAAETHVDRSLLDPLTFIRTNIQGTQVMLDACAQRGLRMVQVSTDEVYGDLAAPERATPTSALGPNNPYAATKAAGDLLAMIQVKTRGQDVVVTRSTNNYGPRQTPEKLIPLMILRAIAGVSLPIYGDGGQVRDWLHVEDHARGIHAALLHASAGDIHHFAGGNEFTNLAVVNQIISGVDARPDQIRHLQDRPAHDRRYALDDRATRQALDWAPLRDFGTGLAQTLAWYQENSAWCQAAAGDELQAFLATNYAGRPTHN